MASDNVLFVFGGAVITSLAGCVGFLFKSLQTQYDLLMEKSNQCEKDREELWRELAKIKTQLNEKE